MVKPEAGSTVCSMSLGFCQCAGRVGSTEAQDGTSRVARNRAVGPLSATPREFPDKVDMGMGIPLKWKR